MESPKPLKEITTSSKKEILNISINNNIAARQWKARALACENWAKSQEEEE